MTDYTDNTPYDPNVLHSVADSAQAIRTKMYGKDTREAMAQMGEKLVAEMSDTGFNAGEIIDARGSFNTLGTRENNQDSQITTKSDKSYVDAMLASIAQGGPKGIYYSLAALQTALPSGADGTYLVFDSSSTDGTHSYIWDSSAKVWKDLGVYQAVGIADDSVPNTALKGGITSKQLDLVNTSSVDTNYLQLSMATTDGGIYYERDKYYHQNRINVAFAGDSNGLFVPFDLFSDQDDLVLYIAHSGGEYTSDPTLTFSLSDDSHAKLMTIFSQTNTTTAVDKTVVIKNSQIPATATGILITSDYKNNAQFYLWLRNINLDRINLTKYMLNTKIKLEGGKDLLKNVELWNTSVGTILNNDNYCHYKADNTVINKVNAGIKIKGEIDSTKDVYISVTAEYLSSVSTNQTTNVFMINSSGNIIIRNSAIVSAGTLTAGSPIKTIQLKLTPKQMEQYGITGVMYVGIGGKFSDIIITDVQIGNEPFGTGIEYAISKINATNNGEELLGIPLDKITSQDAINVDGLQMVTPNEIVDIANGIITEIQVCTTVSGVHAFYIGILDQNMLLVNWRSFSLYLDKGLNQIDIRNNNIEINQGERLFAFLPNESVYAGSSNMLVFGQGLIQDNKHTPSDTSYSGYIFYKTDNIVPLSYSVENDGYLKINAGIKDDIDSLDNKVTDLSKQSKSVITSPDGSRFRITVGNDGTLSSTKIDPAIVRLFGNSIATHPALQGIGMAASDNKHDYTSLFFSYAKMADDNADCQKFTLSSWESDTTSTDRLMWADTNIIANIPTNTNYVVLQLGDNVNSDTKYATFGIDLKALIGAIKGKAADVQIYVIGAWFNSYADITTLEQAACAAYGATFVNIKDLATTNNKSAIGNVITLPDSTKYTITDSGVAAHPGDNGHQAIADRLIAALDF